MTEIAACLEFWFAPGMKARWFKKAQAFDREVRETLGQLHDKAAAGAFDHWRETPEGCVALVILLDQVPRHLYRNDARAFATDAAARTVTYHALDRAWDRRLSQDHCGFLYMPLQHSEDLEDQELSVRLTASLDQDSSWHEWAIPHRDIIARFGRFPHRNAALGRTSTAEESEFLKQPGSSF